MTTDRIKRGTRITKAVMDAYLIEPYTITIDDYSICIQARYTQHVLARIKHSNKFNIQINEYGHIDCARGQINLTLTS